jgi:diacylglycerol kinase family enzyme
VRRLLLIANPVASGFTASAHRDVVEILSGAFEVATVWPGGPDEACRIAAQAAAEGVHVVAAMGGDGIAHRVANGIVGTATALAVVPAGSTNVLAGILGLSRNPQRAAQRIASGTIVAAPTLRIGTPGPAGPIEDLVLFSAGVGLDADIVARAERDPIRKVGFGPIHYARSTLAVVLKAYQGAFPTLRVSAPGRRSDAVGVFVQIHDRYTDVARLPMRLTPNRGAGLTALVVQRITAPVFSRVLARGLTGRDPGRIPGVDVWPGIDSLTVEADPPARYQADGELLGDATRVDITRSGPRLLVVSGSA